MKLGRYILLVEGQTSSLPVSSLQRQTNLRSATNSELFVPHTRLRVGE